MPGTCGMSWFFDILENFWVTDASPHRGGRDPKLTADRQKQPPAMRGPCLMCVGGWGQFVARVSVCW